MEHVKKIQISILPCHVLFLKGRLRDFGCISWEESQVYFIIPNLLLYLIFYNTVAYQHIKSPDPLNSMHKPLDIL